jgi:hypothetical protein
MTFAPFDPLEIKNSQANAALGSLKREIENILSSYVGWYDPFCELIQNALDAVEARAAFEHSAGSKLEYRPQVDVFIDLPENSLTVSDNGIGLDKDRFEQFLAPNLSFKSGNKTRGHKGVGATYAAYGFNFLRVTTKTPGFEASGRIVGARDWLRSNTAGGNPKVEPDESELPDPALKEFNRGVSVTVRFDKNTHPRDLRWIKATSAATWWKILSVKTGLGSVTPDSSVRVSIRVRADGNIDEFINQGTRYFWLHEHSGKNATFEAIREVENAQFKKYGGGYKMPDKFNNLDFVHQTWTPDTLLTLLETSLGEEEREVLNRHSPTVQVEFGYTAKIWSQFNDSLGLRAGLRLLPSGIQLAANNMPQGEVIQVPLNRNIGRQNQVHFLFHFNDYTPDLGRKGFHRELVDFAKNVARSIMESHLSKTRSRLKPATGVSPDLARQLAIGDWKREMLAHEGNSPLRIISDHFFLPVKRLSITSAPTREQDVIALFHELIAGGVIRGINIMSTNERFTYDGLFKIAFDLDSELYVYDSTTNPLGIPRDAAQSLEGRVTDPRVLEYKYSLDGLIEELESQDKHIKDIDLCVVWATGEMYRERYAIKSLLIPENSDQREYHGVTHVLADLETGAKFCDLIVLGELIDSLNSPKGNADVQRGKYE